MDNQHTGNKNKNHNAKDDNREDGCQESHEEHCRITDETSVVGQQFSDYLAIQAFV